MARYRGQRNRDLLLERAGTSWQELPPLVAETASETAEKAGALRIGRWHLAETLEPAQPPPCARPYRVTHSAMDQYL